MASVKGLPFHARRPLRKDRSIARREKQAAENNKALKVSTDCERVMSPYAFLGLPTGLSI
jgi:hypothetical protein